MTRFRFHDVDGTSATAPAVEAQDSHRSEKGPAPGKSGAVRSGVFLCDFSGQVVACDQSLLSLLDRERGEILGSAAEDLLTVAPDQPHPVVITLERRASAAASVRSRFGGPSRLLLTEPWHGTGGAVVGRLVDSERDFETSRAVLAAMVEGVVVRSISGSYVACNDAAQRILGLTRAQLTGRDPIDERWRPIREDGSTFPLEEYPTSISIRTGRACRDVIIGVEKPTGETTWISVSSQPLTRPGEDRPWAVLASFSDITRLKETQEALELSLGLSQELNQELERKNAELERYAYTVAHDLKSPLTAIVCHLELARDAADEGDLEDMREELDRIDVAAERMRDLLEELLELSKLGEQVVIRDGIDLGEVLAEALEMVPGEIDGRSVQWSLPNEMPTVAGDRLRLRQVFQNLLDNACKFMGEQARPRVRVEVSEVRMPKGGRRGAEVRVIDNGVGIEPDRERDIFTLFRTLGHAKSGSGIGLALVERIVELHGGTIRVESGGRGRGCTFVLCLPLGPGHG